MGNVRLSYSDLDKSGDIDKETEIIEENNYYPFGLKHRGYNEIVNAETEHKFRFNDTEFDADFDLNWYNMPLRHQDPTTGRWNGIDPVTHFSSSTYSGYENNPVFWADPSGASVWCKIKYAVGVALSTQGGKMALNVATNLGVSKINGAVNGTTGLGGNRGGSGVVPGYFTWMLKMQAWLLNKMGSANAKGSALSRVHLTIYGKIPSISVKTDYYFASYVQEFGGFTDAEDVSVIFYGKTVSGQDATGLDYGFAAFGILVPMVSGGSAKTLLKNLISTEPIMQSTRKISQMSDALSHTKSTDDFLDLFKNVDTPIEVINVNNTFYIHNGHHRIEAIKQAGVAYDIPVVVIPIEKSRFKNVEELLDAANQ